MLGDNNNTINTPMMEQLMTMLNNRFNTFEENNNKMNINYTTMNNNMTTMNNIISNINVRVETIQAENAAKIDTRSRLSSRAS
jgi:hypothetical protein